MEVQLVLIGLVLGVAALNTAFIITITQKTIELHKVQQEINNDVFKIIKELVHRSTGKAN